MNKKIQLDDLKEAVDHLQKVYGVHTYIFGRPDGDVDVLFTDGPLNKKALKRRIPDGDKCFVVVSFYADGEAKVSTQALVPFSGKNDPDYMLQASRIIAASGKLLVAHHLYMDRDNINSLWMGAALAVARH